MVLGFTGFAANAVIGFLSIIFLVFGADKVVEKMQGVAKAFGVSESVIAVSIVSLGTSLPELVQHVVGSLRIVTEFGWLESGITSINCTSAANTYCDISSYVLGNNIGSDVIQQTLVLGLVILTAAWMKGNKEFRFSKKFLLRDYAPMMGTTLLTLILAWDGTLSRIDGGILLSFFAGYMYYQYTKRTEKLERQGDGEPSQKPYLDLIIGFLLMGVVIGSADIFLRVVEIGIAATGLSGSMIGVIIGGVVSALPEMTTAIQGLRQGAEGISLGTLIGSNILNPLLAIGAGAYISTYAVPRPLVLWDLPMETITAAVLLVYLLNKNRIGNVLSRPAKAAGMTGLAERFEAMEDRTLTLWGSALLILMFVVYVVVRWTVFPADF
ncbi:MAG: sodium:calcium antiporter [Nanohaloarchaea archaeon]|nr:sodium:calcium antiporter [Candidatus Nanohaloarchaea archaeon]